jgi:hypothetical protein
MSSTALASLFSQFILGEKTISVFVYVLEVGRCPLRVVRDQLVLRQFRVSVLIEFIERGRLSATRPSILIAFATLALFALPSVRTRRFKLFIRNNTIFIGIHSIKDPVNTVLRGQYKFFDRNLPVTIRIDFFEIRLSAAPFSPFFPGTRKRGARTYCDAYRGGQDKSSNAIHVIHVILHLLVVVPLVS